MTPVGGEVLGVLPLPGVLRGPEEEHVLAEMGQSLRPPGVVEGPCGDVHRSGRDVGVRVGDEEGPKPVGQGEDVVGAGIAWGLTATGQLPVGCWWRR